MLCLGFFFSLTNAYKMTFIECTGKGQAMREREKRGEETKEGGIYEL